MLVIKSVIKCSNWDYNQESSTFHNNSEVFQFMPWFYLHGEAEHLNGFDCVEADIHTFKKVLSTHLFLAQLLFKDGSKQDVLIIPYIKHKTRLSGLICLCTDIEHIRHALFEYDNDCYKDTCMEESEKQYVYEKYPEIREIIKEYNHNH